LWRSAAIEHDLRIAEHDRAHALAERILQQAPTSAALFEALPTRAKAVLRADGTLVFDDVGWLEQEPSPLDGDPVAEDRLNRAAQAEFVAHDQAEAQRQFDELLAGPLVEAIRLRVLVAAWFQALRADQSDRAATLLGEVQQRAASIGPHDLGRPAIARIVAALCRTGWRDGHRLAAYLPPDVAASLDDEQWGRSHLQVDERRQVLRAMLRTWQQRTPTTSSGIAVGDERHLFCWITRPDDSRDLAWVTPRCWVDALERAMATGAVPAIGGPWRFTVADTTTSAFGAPGIAGIVRPDAGSVWLRPGLLGALLVGLAAAFALAVRWQLRAARAEVAAARTQSEFLTTVTHELKTPLAAIRLLGEMLAEGRAKGREDDYYRMLAGEAGRLSLLIENVLDLGRIERGDRAFDVRPLDAGEVVGETLAMFTPLLERDGGVVRWDDLCGTVRVRADREALVQALVAVLDNARKYGGTPQRLEVVTRRDDDHLAIDVRDHGPGVAPAERDRIFERFVRGSAHAHGSTPGVGIGLHLARRLLRASGGDLVCGDPLDGGPGARFTFRLPLETPA
jgi:signal transduction histidine kinase